MPMANKTNVMRNAVLTLLGACSCLLAACSSVSTEQKVPIVVDSDPPGARVEANGQFIGTTPLKTEIHRYKNPQTGDWSGFAITAFPTQPGQCSQKKVFPENAPMATHMYFDMSLCPYTSSSSRSAG